MSRRMFRTPDHQVDTGWDRPLGSHHLTITSAHTGEVQYSNLQEEDPALDPDRVMAILAAHGIDAPAGPEDELIHDARTDAGNRLVEYDPPPAQHTPDSPSESPRA